MFAVVCLCREFLSPSFVETNFDNNFIKTCLRHDGFHPIPAGDAVRRGSSTLHVKSFPIKFRQEDLPLCVLYSMLSSLWFYGDTHAINILEQEYYGRLEGQTDFDSKRQKICGRPNRCPRVNSVFQIMWGKHIKWAVKDLGDYRVPADEPGYSVADELSKRIRAHEILLLLPVARDGHTTHAVCIVKKEEVCP